VKRSIRSAAEHLLMLFAFLWPWEVCQFVPVLQVHLTEVLALALIILCVIDAIRRRRFRFPFELIWPASVLLGLVTYGALRGYLAEPVSGVGCLLLFVATTHFARRTTVAQCLKLTAVSGAGVAALSMLAPTLGLIPSAYSLETGATLVGVQSLAGGALTLTICLAASRSFLSLQREKRGASLAAITILVLILVALVVRLYPQWAQATGWRPAGLLRGSTSVLCMKLGVLWIAARVAAKLVICGRERPDGAAAALLWALTATAVFTLAFSWKVTGAHAVLLGLAVAAARPGKIKETKRIPGTALWALAPVAALVCYNVWVVFPDNPYDPRNYDLSAAEDFSRGDMERLEQRLEFFEERAPTERHIHLWRARLALQRRQLHYAAEEFAQALDRESPAPVILGWPTMNERDDFLIRLRDASSTMPDPEGIFAYEQSLVASGQDAQALATLKRRVRASSTRVPEDVSDAPLRSAVGMLLAGHPIAGWPQNWSAGELVGLLGRWGTDIGPAPEGFPREHLPLVVVARCWPGGTAAIAYGGEVSVPLAGPWHAPAPPEGTSPLRLGATDAPIDARWSDFQKRQDGQWVSALVVEGKQVGELQAGQKCRFALPTKAEWPDQAPDKPVIRIWLP
jgi:hypothetical protein